MANGEELRKPFRVPSLDAVYKSVVSVALPVFLLYVASINTTLDNLGKEMSGVQTELGKIIGKISFLEKMDFSDRYKSADAQEDFRQLRAEMRQGYDELRDGQRETRERIARNEGWISELLRRAGIKSSQYDNGR